MVEIADTIAMAFLAIMAVLGLFYVGIIIIGTAEKEWVVWFGVFLLVLSVIFTVVFVITL